MLIKERKYIGKCERYHIKKYSSQFFEEVLYRMSENYLPNHVKIWTKRDIFV